MNRENFSSLLDEAEEAVMLIRESGEIIFVNDAALQFFRLRQNTEVPSSIYTLFEQSVHQRLDYFLSQPVEYVQQHTFTEKTLMIFQNGAEQPVSLLVSRVNRQEAKLFMVVLEELLPTEDEEAYKAVAERSSTAISIYNGLWQCLFANTATSALAGSSEKYHETDGFLAHIVEKERATVRQAIAEDIEQQRAAQTHTYRIRRQNNQIASVTNHLKYLYDKDGQVQQWIAHEWKNSETDSAPDELFILTDPHLTIGYVSANCADYLGYSARELTTDCSLTDLLHPDDRDKPQVFSSEYIVSGIVSVIAPLRIKQRTGAYLMAQTRIDRFFDSRGELAYLVLRLGKTDGQSRFSEPDRVQYFKLTAQHTDDVVCFYNRDLTFRYVSPSVSHVLGYAEDELVDQNIADLLHPEDAPRIRQLFFRARHEAVENTHCRIRNSSGNYIEVALSFKVIEQQGSSQLPLLTLLRGIGQATTSSYPSSPTLDSMFNHLSDGLILLNPDDWTIIDSNDRAGELLGVMSRSQLLGRSLTSFWNEEQAETIRSELAALSPTQGQDVQYIRPSGGHFWGDTSLVPLPTADSPTLLVRIADISQRKQMEERLTRAKEEAEEMVKTQENFWSTMSHEIRTPLNAVLGITDLMLDSDLREDQKKLLETLKFSGNNLTALVNEILDYAKLEAGEITLKKQPFSLLKFMRGTKLTYKNLANSKEVSFRLLKDDDLPETAVGDVNRLGQILNNLLNNAVKFTHEGSITLSVYVEETTDEMHYFSFEVTDTGIGIPSHQLAGIFDPYQQAGEGGSPRYGGTGLGLSVVKTLVELQGGNVVVQSEEGRGTTFCVRLPFGISKTEVLENNTLPLVSDYASLNRLRVLYADDVVPNQLLMEGLATKWDVALDTALNGQEALRKAQKNRYDVILMDIQMPKMDGFEATRAIRNLTDLAHQAVPVIALSASVSDDTQHQIREAGMNDYLPKPLDIHRLHAKLASFARSVVDVPSDTSWDEASEQVSEPDFAQLRELYTNDDEGYREILEQIRLLTDETQILIREAIHHGKPELFRVAAHKIMSYVRMLKLRHLEELLSDIKQQLGANDQPYNSEELIKRVQFHFSRFLTTITQEIDVYTS